MACEPKVARVLPAVIASFLTSEDLPLGEAEGKKPLHIPHNFPCLPLVPFLNSWLLSVQFRRSHFTEALLRHFTIHPSECPKLLLSHCMDFNENSEAWQAWQICMKMINEGHRDDKWPMKFPENHGQQVYHHLHIYTYVTLIKLFAVPWISVTSSARWG